MKNKIPKPIMFNAYKHHYYFINEQIQLWKKNDKADIKSQLLKLGDNLLDFYWGKLTVDEICSECIKTITELKVFEKEKFVHWLTPAGFKKIKLSDTSGWIIKEGEANERYVHIHPAKNSVYTTRVRATTLKTVIALEIKSGNGDQPTIVEVNDLRMNYLGLSPIKKLQEGKGIIKLWQQFKQM